MDKPNPDTKLAKDRAQDATHNGPNNLPLCVNWSEIFTCYLGQQQHQVPSSSRSETDERSEQVSSA